MFPDLPIEEKTAVICPVMIGDRTAADGNAGECLKADRRIAGGLDPDCGANQRIAEARFVDAGSVDMHRRLNDFEGKSDIGKAIEGPEMNELGETDVEVGVRPFYASPVIVELLPTVIELPNGLWFAGRFS